MLLGFHADPTPNLECLNPTPNVQLRMSNANPIPSRQLQLTLPLRQHQLALQFITTFYKPKPGFSILHSSFPFLIILVNFRPTFLKCQLSDALL